MEKEKNIIIMENQNLKESIQMEKEMEMGKSIMNLVNYILKENFQVEKEMEMGYYDII